MNPEAVTARLVWNQMVTRNSVILHLYIADASHPTWYIKSFIVLPEPEPEPITSLALRCLLQLSRPSLSIIQLNI